MIETVSGIAHPSLCDVLGHLNTRAYFNLFDDASFHFLDALGEPCDALMDQRKAWADVRAEILYRAEVPLGRAFVVDSGVIALGRSSITFRHELRSADRTVIHASMQVVSVFFDLAARRATALPETVRQAAMDHLIAEP